MAHIGYGYGSEWHLLQYLGRRRDAFTRQVQSLIGSDEIRWCDHDERVQAKTGWVTVSEPRGLEFLSATEPVREAWEDQWPQSGNVHNWDAVGYSASNGVAWVLVEAKASIGELESNCGAKDPDSIRRIRRVLDETRATLGVTVTADWMSDYYHYCNRVALLHFLHRHGVKAHLLFVYFTGDRLDVGAAGRDCPVSPAGWREALDRQDRHAGLPPESPIRRSIHRLFLPAYRANIAEQVLKPEYLRPTVASELSSEAHPASQPPASGTARAFDEAMMQIYLRAKKEAGYNATRFHQMLTEHGGTETARRLLPSMSDGFTQLWQRNRLDLTVESLILEPRWKDLFSDDERLIARDRLRECGAKV